MSISKEKSVKFKRYMIVLEIKKEHLKEYCDIHRNPWPELLNAIKSSGVKELVLWNYKNLSIVYYETEDIDKLYKKLNEIDAIKRWNITVSPWISVAPILDGTGKMDTCEKIFDLNQQIKGELGQF